MSKAAEQNYLYATRVAGREHSIRKPFSDEKCGTNLASIGTIMVLLPSPPARILDMGCGGGWTSTFLAQRGYEVVGQDISEDMIDLANANAARKNITAGLSFVCSDYESNSFSEPFDAVLFFDCLHHAEDECAALASAYRALTPGGICITHEPGEGHAETAESVEAMRLYGVSERDMPPHLIIKHARNIGFSASRIYPMQGALLSIFYREPVPAIFSKLGRRRIKQLWKLAFNPSDRGSAIVVLTI